jgi:DNA-binding MarR family transcriptional regulator
MKLMRRGTQSHQALMVLGLAGGALDRRALLRMSGLSKTALNTALHSLQGKGFIRMRNVELTEKGREALELFALHWAREKA